MTGGVFDSDGRLVADLLSYMTMEERLGQLRILELGSVDRDAAGNLRAETLDLVRAGRVAGVTRVRDLDEARLLQETAVEQSRFGVPLVLSLEQSAADIPQSHLLQASWQPGLVYEYGRALALQAIGNGASLAVLPPEATRDSSDIGRHSPERVALLKREILDALGRGLEGGGTDGVLTLRKIDPDAAARLVPSVMLGAIDAPRSARPGASVPPRRWLYITDAFTSGRPVSNASEIDRSVREVLTAKARMGLLRDPYRRLAPTEGNTAASAARLSRTRERIDQAAMILLANEDRILPLTRDDEDILVIGTHAGASAVCNRALSAFGIAHRSVSGLAMRPEGETMRDEAMSPDGLAIGMACDAAGRARTVLFAVDDGDCDRVPGAPAYVLKGPAQTLLRALARDHNRIIMVAATRRPVMLGDLTKRVAAHLLAWSHSAEPAWEARLGEILTGQVPPSGRLPFNVPAAGESPAVPASHGLTYGSVRYHAIEVEWTGTRLLASVTIVNSGDEAAAATVQLYVQPPAKQSAQARLRAFRTVMLTPGSRETVNFELGLTQLGQQGDDGRWHAEPGTYRIAIGASSSRILSRDIDLPAAVIRAMAAGLPIDLATARRA